MQVIDQGCPILQNLRWGSWNTKGDLGTAISDKFTVTTIWKLSTVDTSDSMTR